MLLLVSEKTGDHWSPVFESSDVTALGEGTRRSGKLSEAGIRNTLRAVKIAFDDAKAQGAESIVAAATMAARIASNTEEFLARAKEQGTPISVLSGEQEAELGFRAVAEDPAFSAHENLSTIDVGGHSTEIVSAEKLEGGRNVAFRQSYAVGTLGLREALLEREHLTPQELLHASTSIDDSINQVAPPIAKGVVVALGATGTNLVSIRDRLAEWEPGKVHGACLSYEEIGRAAGWLSAMTDAQRAALIGIEKGREKTIHIGALILERALFAIKAEGCLVSVRGWRYAML